jgi:peptide/nickel transport system permease protein
VFRFIVRRLLQLIPILLGLSVLLFAWLRALPGGPAQAALGERASPEDIARYNELFGLDESIVVQYLRFLGRAITLDFGTSARTGRPVTTEFLERFPGTIELTICAMIFAIGLGIPLGYLAARKHGTWIDSASVIGSLIGVAIRSSSWPTCCAWSSPSTWAGCPAPAARTCAWTPPASPTSTCSTAC